MRFFTGSKPVWEQRATVFNISAPPIRALLGAFLERFDGLFLKKKGRACLSWTSTRRTRGVTWLRFHLPATVTLTGKRPLALISPRITRIAAVSAGKLYS